jgi:hypothetical protein
MVICRNVGEAKENVLMMVKREGKEDFYTWKMLYNALHLIQRRPPFLKLAQAAKITFSGAQQGRLPRPSCPINITQPPLTRSLAAWTQHDFYL